MTFGRFHESAEGENDVSLRVSRLIDVSLVLLNFLRSLTSNRSRIRRLKVCKGSRRTSRV